MSPVSSRRIGQPASTLALLGLLSFTATVAAAQSTGSIGGTVTRATDGEPLANVSIVVEGTSISTVSSVRGTYDLPRVPEGEYSILFRWLGFQPVRAAVIVTPGGTHTVDARMEAHPIQLGELVVRTASRAPERVVEAPAAVSVVEPYILRAQSATAQMPNVLATVPGVDLVQSGVTDFNVNARGFNSSLNRRVLILQDGRDLAVAFLGSQEWNSLSIPLEDMARVEMVRGPGSALYGANAFSGVLNITTPTAREVIGTKLSLAGGELSTFRGDLRHAGVTSDGRFGYRFNVGYTRSDTWTKARTRFDSTALAQEYSAATDDPIPLTAPERLPLAGQSVDPTTGAATGDPDDIQNIYGSARFDYYADDGSVLTFEGGGSRVENELFVTGIGRVQVNRAIRPWARAAWAHNNYNVSAWWSGRNTVDPQISLASTLPLEEESNILHVEAQYNRSFLQDDRARVVVGTSFRQYLLDTQGTLMALANDDRSDSYYSAYGQFEIRLAPQVRAVVASRFDEGDLFSAQWSPKAALVISPTDQHSFRVSVNRAFQTPNYSEFFLSVPVRQPTGSPFALEQGLEQYFAGVLGSPVGPAVADLNLPTDLPWDFNQMTNTLALGNADLDVEKVTGWEFGYKGAFADRAYVTVDVYFNRLSNFVTDLLPGVNPAFPTYLLTDQGTDIPATLAALDQRLASLNVPANSPLRAPIPALLAGYGGLNAQAGPLLATLPDGSRALVVSYANAGRVNEGGIEFGLGVSLTPELRTDVTYTFFDFSVREQQAGDALLPNTPQHKGTVGLTYTGAQGVDFNVNARFLDGYDWAAGIFAGTIPSSQTLNLSAGYRINNYVRIHSTATNVLDQDRYQIYGGSVIGRRILGGITATF